MIGGLFPSELWEGRNGWMFHACFPFGSAQSEQQFQVRTDLKPGWTNLAEMAPGMGHSGEIERVLSCFLQS